MKKTLSFLRVWRLQAVSIAFCIGIMIIVARLFYLQIDKQGMLHTLGERNFLRMEIISPLRGDVYDRNRKLLAANRPVYDVSWHNCIGQKMNDQDVAVLSALEGILAIDLCSQEKLQELQLCHKTARRQLLKADVSFEQLCQISEQCTQAPHLVITNRFQRLYPHEMLGCHVLGYLNRIENVGKSGVESHFDAQLQGNQGYTMHVINATGKTLMKKIHTHARAGKDLTLTIDLELQKLAEGLFKPDQAGAVLLMDPETGDLQLMASHPTFNPNAFLSPLSDDEWSRLAINNPLLNRATCALYPPASIFKLVIMTAGLEDKHIEPAGEVLCCGHIEFCGRKYHCIRRTGHGLMNQKQALAVSCNIPFFNLARKMNIDRIAHFADLFGIGKKTGLALPEKAGLMPTRAWKKDVRNERWWKGETLSTCIGQGYTLVTPLQTACMIGAVCTGKLVQPRLNDEEEFVHSLVPVSTQTLQFLRNGMREAVQYGSAQRLKGLRGFEIAAKTGTAQTCSLSVEQLYKHQMEHAWFGGFFSYQGQKPLVLVIIIENAGHSRDAVELAHRFLVGYRALQESEAKSQSDS